MRTTAVGMSNVSVGPEWRVPPPGVACPTASDPYEGVSQLGVVTRCCAAAILPYTPASSRWAACWSRPITNLRTGTGDLPFASPCPYKVKHEKQTNQNRSDRQITGSD
jgi:hypothetical protein